MCEIKMNKPLLNDILPEVAKEIEALLRIENLNELADQVPTLKVFDKCRCGDSFCSSFYTTVKPDGGWGPMHENIMLNPNVGDFILDVVDGRIVFVEILDRDDIHSSLNKAVK